MTTRGKEFIERKFKRLLQEWYQPKEGFIPPEAKFYGENACMVIKKVLEEFAAIHSKYKLLSKESPHLKNDTPTQLVPGFDPGHTLVTYQEQECLRMIKSISASNTQ
ncbi:hypothetical protein DSO57_1012429 [Entomophthora muscae]|uniref:Uncharacterized protein n=1 Tax=Entomophthora muscae TaxID=34485 RepID=A0ACC2RKQ2_9FUNG|nr:hypothetical protein DSO57_1012429 [Entomophthora muscae]